MSDIGNLAEEEKVKNIPRNDPLIILAEKGVETEIPSDKLEKNKFYRLEIKMGSGRAYYPSKQFRPEEIVREIERLGTNLKYTVEEVKE